MSEEQKEHPLEEYPEKERVVYLSILSAICYVDKEFSDKEKRQLDILLKQLEISDEGKSRIYSIASINNFRFALTFRSLPWVKF